MPAQGITGDEVAAWLGVPLNARITECAAAATRWAEKRRCKTNPDELWTDEDVRLGTTQYAALLYQRRAAPEGFDGYDDMGATLDTQGQAIYDIWQLVGLDPVIA